ncbi:hypothetical protein L228DRAFT_266952 [Xylona heveae TC161]|uniref:Uncharacterized protein n=1 Tax=Xylona heveae (strain CBS 132557 / TC161) TaxID=1328760 RepID=A0A165IAP0_XYLHT|nr:hypothetical protein L228DRAFT_266952 [Xylona heveae TC161]KZF24632.1 hypothetical protein L228DRAFT_266952 [Xylona heveae TC161]
MDKYTPMGLHDANASIAPEPESTQQHQLMQYMPPHREYDMDGPPPAYSSVCTSGQAGPAGSAYSEEEPRYYSEYYHDTENRQWQWQRQEHEYGHALPSRPTAGYQTSGTCPAPAPVAAPPAPYNQFPPEKGSQEPSCSNFPSPGFGAQHRASVRPCVVPQITKAFGGAFSSPFARCHAPELAAQGITQLEFLVFLDGLNEAFLGSPIFQATNLIGSAIGMVPLHSAQILSGSIGVASGLASAGVSYARTRAYMRASNYRFFGPRGLHATIMNTKKMMLAIGLPEAEERLQLPPLDNLDQAQAQQQAMPASDPRIRRILALGDRVMPLSFDVPQVVMPDNVLKKIGAAHARKLEAKQNRKLEKDRSKKSEEQAKKVAKLDEEARDGDEEIAKVERERDKEERKYQEKLAKYAGDGYKAEKKRAELKEDYDKEMAKLDKDMSKALQDKESKVGKNMKDINKGMSKLEKKEHKMAQKVLWVVILKAEEGLTMQTSGSDVIDDEDE